MTATSFPGMGTGMAPGAPPQAAAPMGGAGFVLIIPPDQAWEPFETTDVLDQDGYYCCKITKESPRNDANKSAGIFLTLEVFDDDAHGKILSRFLPDPRTSKGNVWFIWRGLLMSITGNMELARQGLTYSAGSFVGQYVYVKTERSVYNDRLTTGVDTWITRAQWEEARKNNTHRWPAKAVQQGGGSGNVGALPGGVPGGFPGMGAGLPGSPGPAATVLPGAGLPGVATTPQPGPAPIQQAAPPPPPAQAPPPANGFPTPAAPGGFAPPPPPAAAAPAAAPGGPPPPPAPGQPFGFAQFPGMPAPPPVNGAQATTPQPPPTAASIATSFPAPQPPQQ